MAEKIKQEAVTEVETTEVNATPDVAEKVTEEVKEEAPKTEEKLGFFGKLKRNVAKKIDETKHKMEVGGEINRQFGENAKRFTLIDQGIKGVFKPLFEVDSEAKTFTFLGSANYKENTLLKDKEGNLFKILNKVEGEYTRTFTALGEEHVRELEIYNYKEV